MDCFAKIFNSCNLLAVFIKIHSQMFGRVLNTSLFFITSQYSQKFLFPFFIFYFLQEQFHTNPMQNSNVVSKSNFSENVPKNLTCGSRFFKTAGCEILSPMGLVSTREIYLKIWKCILAKSNILINTNISHKA